MNREPSPKDVRLGAQKAVDWAVFWAVYRTVSRVVFIVMSEAVNEAVPRSVNAIVRRSVLWGRSHPNFHLFLSDIRQSRRGAL